MTNVAEMRIDIFWVEKLTKVTLNLLREFCADFLIRLDDAATPGLNGLLIVLYY